MNKRFTVKQNRTFRIAYKKGRRNGGRYFTVYALPNREGHCRLGITVGKRFGNSVQRSRFKRLVRESYRQALPDITGSFDIIVAARSSQRTVISPNRKLRADRVPTYEEIRHEYFGALMSLGIVNIKKEKDI